MTPVEKKSKGDGETQDRKALLGDGHKGRRMHSFDRRIKSAHKELNPDLDADVPSYMRQTCASLVKRSTFKIKDLEMLDPRCARPRTCKDRKQRRSKSVASRESRRQGSRSSSRRSIDCSTPCSVQSMVAESIDGSPSPSETNPPRYSAESIIPAVQSIEPEADAEDMSSMMEACFDDVIHDAFINGAPSVSIDGVNLEIRGLSFSSSVTVDDKSEAARDDSDSFCLVYDSDDGKSMETVKLPLSDLVELTEEEAQSPRPLTPESDYGVDIFDVIEEAKWLEDEEEEQLTCHRLTDILASYTESEFGDMSSHTPLDRIPYIAEGIRKSSDELSHLNIHKIAFQEDPESPKFETLEDEMQRSWGDRKVKPMQSFQVGTPGFLMMLGGNVLAGVVGAAIASAGMQISTQSHTVEVNDDCRLEGDPLHDWFFESTILGRKTADEVYQ